MSFLRLRVLFVAAAASLLVGGSLVVGAAPAGAKPPAGVHCGAGDLLQPAMDQAAPGATITVDGICYGNFVIHHDLTLVGPATLDGASSGTVLSVDFGTTVTLNNLTIRNGTGTDFSGVFVVGGGIDNNGTLTLNGSTVTGNSANATAPETGFGGGIVNVGTMVLNRSMVSDNTASESGGGIFNFGFFANASLTLNGSTVSNNSTSTDGCQGCGGGAIYDGANSGLQSVVTINQSTLSGNRSLPNGTGGAINTGGPVTINGSTIQDNHAFVGGGIFTNSALTINKSVASDNRGALAGAIAVYANTTTVANSTFTNNPGSPLPPFMDNPAGIFVFPLGFFGSQGGTFTTTHSTFS
jgi:hypothetical protein